MVTDALFPLSYLSLVREDGKLLLRRDFLYLFGVAALTGLLVYFAPNLNFFGPSGVVDKLGSLSSTLTGFYVAALVGAATFTSHISDLDKYLLDGSLYLSNDQFASSVIPEHDEEDVSDSQITRRQYICLIFGYLAFTALTLSILSIAMVAVSSAISPGNQYYTSTVLKYIFSLFYSLLAAHMALTTARGIFYLSYKMYLGDGEAVQVEDIKSSPTDEDRDFD